MICPTCDGEREYESGPVNRVGSRDTSPAYELRDCECGTGYLCDGDCGEPVEVDGMLCAECEKENDR